MEVLSMINIFVRAFLDLVFFVITLPIRLLIVLIWLIFAIRYALADDSAIKDYLDGTKSAIYENIKNEIKWIKTGKV